MINFLKRIAIRNAYKNWTPESCPYDYGDWVTMLTPIERNIWNEIRFYQLPFYPQYPVGKYFVDFADPIKKIVIEVDGKYHAFTKLADEHRQRRIERLGWTVLRIKGRDTFTRTHDFFSYLSETYYDPL